MTGAWYSWGTDILHAWATSRASFLIDLFVFLADDLPYAIGMLALIPLTRMRSWTERFVFILEAVLAVAFARLVLVEGIRLIVRTVRPYVAYSFAPLIAPVLQPAFPSGHAAFLAALAFAVTFHSRAWGWLLLFLVALNGTARMFVGVHYPFDILAGIAVGLVAALSVRILFQLSMKHYELA